MATKNDKLVLNTIFNPFEPNLGLDDDEPSNGACPIESHLTDSDQPIDHNLEKLKQLELEGVKLAEEGK